MIRLADDPRDIAHFLTIRRSFGMSNEEVETKRETYLDDLIDREGRACFLLLDERGSALGYIQLVWANELPGSALLHDLRVKVNQQSKGCGEKLVAFVEAEAAIRGFHYLKLWVEPTNERAQKFYSRLGYAIDGSREGAILMAKYLARS